jgi:hypothetical protein
METVDVKTIERLCGYSERIVGDRYIVYQRSISNDFVNFDLFHIDDIHEPLQSFRMNVSLPPEPHFFSLFHIFEDKLYFFSKFDHQNANVGRAILNLGAIHVYDMKSGRKEKLATSALPIFHYSPPSNLTRVVGPMILNSSIYWILATSVYSIRILGRLAVVRSNQRNRESVPDLPSNCFGYLYASMVSDCR